MYGSLVLEDCSDLGEAVPGRYSISCVHFSSLRQRSGPTVCNWSALEKICWMPLLVKWGSQRFDSRKGQLTKRPRMLLEYLFMVYQLNFCALEQSWLHDSRECVTSQIFSRCRENRNVLWETSLVGPVDGVPFHGNSHREQPPPNFFSAIKS